jgi:dihydroorotate dehydrogenase (NAD+) catalytic subunit
VKLSPAARDIVAVARAALSAGAEALTLVNTMPAEAIGVTAEHGALGFGAGGVSGRLLHPIALDCVSEVARACPGVPIVAAGGVFSAAEAVEFLRAGARAVEVGTATFLDPRAPRRILSELIAWCEDHGIFSIASLYGSGHG